MTLSTADLSATPARPSLRDAMWRGVRERCPACGQGRLFRRYLKPVEACSVCGEHLGHVRSDDAAPWLTILIVGHIVVPLLLMVEQVTDWPLWVPMVLWPTVAAALMFPILPRAKGLLMAIIWATGAPGSERD